MAEIEDKKAGGSFVRALPPGWGFCPGGSCVNPIPIPNKKNFIKCETTDSCAHKKCKCHLFSFDPNKPEEPYKHERDPDKEFEEEFGRKYACLCVHPT